MAIFRVLDDTETGPRLKSLGITDEDLISYIVARGRGRARQDDAFKALLRRKALGSKEESDFVRSIVESLPVLK